MDADPSTSQLNCVDLMNTSLLVINICMVVYCDSHLL